MLLTIMVALLVQTAWQIYPRNICANGDLTMIFFLIFQMLACWNHSESHALTFQFSGIMIRQEVLVTDSGTAVVKATIIALRLKLNALQSAM